MKRKRIIPIVVIAIVIIAVAVFFARRPKNDENVIVLSGNIEVDEVELSFKVPGRIAERPVREGERVAAGQLVARLEGDDFSHEVALRSAELDAAVAKLAEIDAGVRREEIGQASAAADLARAEVERASSEYNRSRKLHSDDVISTREFEVAETALQSARARLKQATERHTMTRTGATPEERAQVAASLKRAREAVAASQTKLSYATLTSPVAGVVLSEISERGEQIAPGSPVVTIGDLDQVWLRAYLSETDLARVRLGSAAKITTDSYPGRTYNGTLSFIAAEAEFTPKSVQTPAERVKLVYRVKIRVANPNHELKPGMPADAELEAGK